MQLLRGEALVDADTAATASELSAPSTKEHLIRLLGSIVEDDVLLEAVAKRSYRHQLGFSKYVLAIDTSGAALRMHHWDRSDPNEEDIHSHCADFTSTVWLGGFKELTFTLTEGDTHTLYSYNFNDQTQRSEAFPLKLSSVEKLGERKILAGATYCVSSSSLHRVSSVLPGTLTISLWKPRSYSALVLKPKNVQAEPCCSIAGMDSFYLKTKLELIRERLRAECY
jgi:hypothetical protein